MQAPQVLPVLAPRVWYTKAEYSAFSPLFESRQAAIAYYGNEPLMAIAEQTDGCGPEGLQNG